MNETLNELVDKAKLGDGDAAYELGEHFFEKKDYAVAFEWYMKAYLCEKTNPNAYFNVAYSYQYGLGTKIDTIKAYDYYEEAAKFELPHALQNLAYFYLNGIVVEKNVEKATELSKRAGKALVNFQNELYKTQQLYEKTSVMYKTVCIENENQKAELEKKRELCKKQSENIKNTVAKIKEYKKLTEELKEQLSSLAYESEYAAQLSKKQINELKNTKNEFETKVIELSSKNKELTSNVEQNVSLIGTLERNIKQLEDKEISIKNRIYKLKTQKPCIKKKNLLFSIELLMAVMYVLCVLCGYYFADVYDYSTSDYLLVSLLPAFVLFIIERISLKRYVLHGIVEIVCVASAFLPMIFIFEEDGFIFLFSMLIWQALMRIFLAVVSFKKEIYFTD